MTAALSVFLSLFLCLISSCSRSLAERYPVPIVDADELLVGLQAADRAVETDRRIFDFRIRRGVFSTGGEGIFLYQRPDRVRLDLYTGASELVLQYLRAGERSSVLIPAEERIVRGVEGTVDLAGIEGAGDIRVRDDELLALMLGIYRPGTDESSLREAREGGDGVLLRLERGSESVYLQHERGSLRLNRMTVMESGDPVRDIRFRAPTEVGQLERPWSMTYSDRASDLVITVSIREERINEEIAPGVLTPPGGGWPKAPGEMFDKPRDAF